MKRRRLIIMLAAFSFAVLGHTQSAKHMQDFNGATANLKAYKAIFYLNDSSDKIIKGTLRNIKNSLEDPRLQGKLQVELVVFGDGVEAFRKDSGYDKTLLDLQKKGVILAQCLNTMRERNIAKEELYNFISFVPTGNGEIIIRQAQGWSSVHP